MGVTTPCTQTLQMSSLDLLGISSSNHPCSDAERKEISSLLAQLQPLREQQLQMLADTTDKINRCQFALAPHRRVPPEILREIFIWCSHHAGSRNLNMAIFSGGYPKCPSSKLPQLAISRVCSDWRTIALSTPQLWNKVLISRLSPTIMKNADRWLLRAGNLPVIIRIVNNESPWAAVNCFLSHHRLRELELPLYLDFPGLFPDDLTEASCKDLEELTIQSNILQRYYYKPLSLETARLPSLIRLCLIEVPIFIIQPSATVRILEIQSTTISTSQFWDLLRGPSLLEKASFSAVSVDKTPTPADVRNSSLKELWASFVSEDQADFGYIIDPLTLPQLAKLTIYLSGRAQWSTTAYSRMAQRSNFFPHLKIFHLRIGKSDIDSLLTCTPYLKEIDIGGTFAWRNGTIAGLGSGRICPNLEKIALSYVPDVLEFLEMVKVRQESAQLHEGCRVKAFTKAYLGTDIPPSLHPLVGLLKKSGVEVSWPYHP
jgi:hypothetical protein